MTIPFYRRLKGSDSEVDHVQHLCLFGYWCVCVGILLQLCVHLYMHMCLCSRVRLCVCARCLCSCPRVFTCVRAHALSREEEENRTCWGQGGSTPTHTHTHTHTRTHTYTYIHTDTHPSTHTPSSFRIPVACFKRSLCLLTTCACSSLLRS